MELTRTRKCSIRNDGAYDVLFKGPRNNQIQVRNLYLKQCRRCGGDYWGRPDSKQCLRSFNCIPLSFEDFSDKVCTIEELKREKIRLERNMTPIENETIVLIDEVVMETNQDQINNAGIIKCIGDVRYTYNEESNRVKIPVEQDEKDPPSTCFKTLRALKSNIIKGLDDTQPFIDHLEQSQELYNEGDINEGEFKKRLYEVIEPLLLRNGIPIFSS